MKHLLLLLILVPVLSNAKEIKTNYFCLELADNYLENVLRPNVSPPGLPDKASTND